MISHYYKSNNVSTVITLSSHYLIYDLISHNYDINIIIVTFCDLCFFTYLTLHVIFMIYQIVFASPNKAKIMDLISREHICTIYIYIYIYTGVYLYQ